MCQPSVRIWILTIILLVCICVIAACLLLNWVLAKVGGTNMNPVSHSTQSTSRNIGNIEDEQERILNDLAQDCENGSRNQADWCPTQWDGMLCWPSSPSGELSVQPCPNYIEGFDPHSDATKQCMSDGHWYGGYNQTWTNYSSCKIEELAVKLTNPTDVPLTLTMEYLPVIEATLTAGNKISFITDGVAFGIFLCLTTLKPNLNFLQKNLFSSFMVRAIAIILKQIFFIDGLSPSALSIGNMKCYEVTWYCKAFISFCQYSILSNYAVILAVGLLMYVDVHNSFHHRKAEIKKYIFYARGLSAFDTVMWIVLKIYYEENYCWTISENIFIFSSPIKIPFSVTVMGSFYIFGAVVIELGTKGKLLLQESLLSKKKWIIRTLILIPFLGTQHFVFLGMSYWTKNDEILAVVWSFCDQFFTSIQGFLVAVLYCFQESDGGIVVQCEINSGTTDQNITDIREPAQSNDNSATIRRRKDAYRSKKLDVESGMELALTSNHISHGNLPSPNVHTL